MAHGGGQNPANQRHGEVGKPTRSKPASSVPTFGIRRGSAHRSRAVHGVGGRAGKLDSDNVAHRSMAAIDEP
jgi:hypothetical protein